MNILIVDDSVAMRMMIIKTLRQAGLDGHTFVQAPDGVAALEMIRKATPDLVFADWNMPNMSGIDLLTTLRAEGNKVRLGFITTESTAAMRAKASEAGASFLIAKPFTVDAFKSTLEPLLKAG
jgi:two-component system chemotaxis response regulator CheY